jgi:hypothetical protein
MFRRRAPTSAKVVDLTDDLAFTFQLLDQTHAWRHRLVEYATLGDGDHLNAVSAYQIELPPALMAPWVGHGHGKRARILLPLTTRSKRPLLRFAIDGPSGAPAQLLLRSSIAVIQAEYLRTISESSPAAAVLREGMPDDLLEAICAFTPAPFREFEADLAPLDAYQRYLQEGIGIELERADVARWLRRQQSAGRRLAQSLAESADPYSSSEQVLLALPRLHERISSRDDIDQLLDRYVRAVRSAAVSGDDYFLVALADYGRRWEMIVEVEVPLEEAFQIKVHEARPIDIDRGGWIREPTPFALGDARSAHREVRVDDPHVNVSDKRVTDSSTGRLIGVPLVEAARHTRESFALYSSEGDRPYYVDVALRLRVVRGLRVTNWFVGLLTLAATIIATVAPDDDHLIDTLTLLTVPTTFAVALVLVRESSALAVRLQATARFAIATLTGILWTVSIARLAIHL